MIFEEQLTAMISKELAESNGDGQRLADTVEALARTTGMAVAVAARGVAPFMSDMLTATENYIMESASSYAAVIRKQQEAKRASRR